jgi:uncharacterized membrane protein
MLPLLLIKWIHVLAAITAVGANSTYGLWIARASAEPGHLPYVLRNIRLIDNRVANPCYALLLLTGLTMAVLIPIPLTTPWLLIALILYAAAALLGVLAYSPVFKKQIRLLESVGFDSAEYRDVAKQSRLYGILVTLDVAIIVFLMVVKPPLW